MNNEIIGLLGSFCFALCSWPQAFYCLKRKTAAELQWSTVALFLIGSTCGTVFAVGTENLSLLPNYCSGGLGMVVVLCVKLWEKNNGRR